jgi:hypothetical protein
MQYPSIIFFNHSSPQADYLRGWDHAMRTPGSPPASPSTYCQHGYADCMARKTLPAWVTNEEAAVPATL